jgi:sugar phosphate isomerase/epimerase
MATRHWTGGAAAVAALALAASGALAADRACLGLPKDKVGMQLFSVLTELRDPPPPGAPRTPPAPVEPARLDRTLAALHAVGWRNIENFGGDWGLGPAGYKAALDRHGLHAIGAHESLDDAGWSAVLDRAKTLGQAYVGSGGYGQPGLDSLEHVLATADHLNRLGRAAAARGLKFYVHSHQDEFKRTYPYDLDGDGRPEAHTAWEIIAARTDPRYVSFEVDVHWARVAMGLDRFEALLTFLQAHRDRIILLHVKDTAPDGKIADLGRGTTDWRRLIAAAGPQVAYYIWEFDRPPQPLASARIAYAYMTCAAP